jgi:sigma-B regulation protein RsbU (phosphoserine phosphatase)
LIFIESWRDLKEKYGMMVVEKELMEDTFLESLSSAELVQQALLPKKRHFDRLFDDSFVFYRPKHIISGDFYWVGRKHDLTYLVVGDCTGHGISAALLSVLALNLLEYVIMNKGLKKPNKILKEFDKKFIESFKYSDKINEDNPWIDISLVCIDSCAKKIFYSSATRKMLFRKTDGTTTVTAGSRYPIGGWQVEKNRTFDSISFDYEMGDKIYLGSDGFQDQIGGSKNKKYKSKRLHDLLINTGNTSLEHQKKTLVSEFDLWKNTNEQVDDVCIVGVEL